MANDNHLLSVICCNITMQKQDYYNEFFEIGQQKINFSFFELNLPDDDPVYTLKKVLEDIDFSSLTARYSPKGRIGFNPIMMYATVTYAMMQGIKGVDRIVELCERDIAYIWLTKGQKPKRDAFYDFINNRLTTEVLNDLHYQFIRILEKEGLVTLKELFIDGTKIVGKERNSYSKTDIEATFMRMKEDHMLNGQLKPAYNVQIAVENYFIIHTYVSSDRTDYDTLIPVLEKHKKSFKFYPEDVTADSGYCSEKNLIYLREHGINPYIKLQIYEKMKTRAYKNDISKHYNMKYSAGDDCYYCHNGRRLDHVKTEKRNNNGYIQTYEVYSCNNCDGCPHKSKCLYKYNEETDVNKNKTMKINELWEELQAESHANITSEKSILNRQIRSIQTET